MNGSKLFLQGTRGGRWAEVSFSPEEQPAVARPLIFAVSEGQERLWWLQLAVGCREPPCLYSAQRVNSWHLRQPRWRATPVQKKLVRQRSRRWWSCKRHHFPRSGEEAGETDCGRPWKKALHCGRARSLAVSVADSCRKQRIAQGVDTYQEQGKVLPEMSSAVFLAHLIKSQNAP